MRGATRVQRQRVCVRGWWLTKRLHLVGFTCPGQSSFLRWPWRGGGRCCPSPLPPTHPAPSAPRQNSLGSLFLLTKCTHLGRDGGKKLMPELIVCGKKKWPGPILAVQSSSFARVVGKGASARYLDQGS